MCDRLSGARFEFFDNVEHSIGAHIGETGFELFGGFVGVDRCALLGQ